MNLSSLEKNYKGMSEQDILTSLMKIVGPKIVTLTEKYGAGELSIIERLQFQVWLWSRQGRRVIALYKKISGGQRVGITTRPDQRKAQWRSIYPGLRDWQIIQTALSYDQAQALENEFVKQGFDGSPGGPRMGGYNYSVYTFSF